MDHNTYMVAMALIGIAAKLIYAIVKMRQKKAHRQAKKVNKPPVLRFMTRDKEKTLSSNGGAF